MQQLWFVVNRQTWNARKENPNNMMEFYKEKTGENLENKKNLKAMIDLVEIYYNRPIIVVETDSYFYD